MKVKISIFAPVISKKLKPSHFASWEPFIGITEEQDYFHRETYIRFLKSRKREKHIYISEN